MQISHATQRVDADDRQDEPGGWLQAPRPNLAAWALLLAMSAILFAGTWRAHPALSLAAPGVSLVVWWPTLRSNRPERWLFWYVAGIYVYTILRAYADEMGLRWQYNYVIQIDKTLFGGALPSVELQRHFFRPWDIDWIDALASLVHASFFVAPHVALVVVWWRWPAALRAHVLAALLTFFAGLVLFFAVPTVPPWLATYQGEADRVYRVINFVFTNVDRDTYRTLYTSLGEPNSVAAVPSIHMAITCLVLFRVRALMPGWTWPVAIYTGLMAFSLVYLGEHYVFDVIVGVIIASLSEFAARRFEAWRTRPAEPAAVPVLS